MAPASDRTITKADIIPEAEFAKVRSERRRSMLPTKKLRRIEIGPYCTFYFENFDTMLFQVQEMLLIEKGGEEQLKDELAAYNPLIPQGAELVATVMFEIDDEQRRKAILMRLGGVEKHFFIQIGDDKTYCMPEEDTERTTEDGKTSSVHFIRFKIDPSLHAKFRDPGVQLLLGVDHEQYGHVAILSPATRKELAGDFAR